LINLEFPTFEFLIVSDVKSRRHRTAHVLRWKNSEICTVILVYVMMHVPLFNIFGWHSFLNMMWIKMKETSINVVDIFNAAEIESFFRFTSSYSHILRNEK